MRLLKSHYLNDGKLFNDGRPVDLIQIEDEKDFDTLLDNIINSGYYSSSYFDNHIDYREEEVKFDAFLLSAILKFLKPKSLIELGCGRGDVIFLSGLDPRIKVRGIDFSQDVLQKIWPFLSGKVDLGDIFEVSKKYYTQGITFDTFCAFDLWEHILPRKLHECIDSFLALAKKDAMFCFTIPAFGEDRVFGEIFPLEFEENREKFNAKSPFDYLIVESMNPPIPALGHLICAHSEWWQKQFEKHGLVRAEDLESNIHTYFDEHLFYARKSLYIFYLDSPEARSRVSRLSREKLTLFRKWKILVEQEERIRRWENDQERSLLDRNELKATIKHAEVYMILDLKKKMERWTGQTLQQKMKGRLLQRVLSRLKKWVIDAYVRGFRNGTFLFDSHLKG
jgi:hypothetical protein